MFHKHRTWAIHRVESAEILAEMLTTRTWTLCSGFVIAGHEEYLFLNDATHEDGACEYGVIRGGLSAERRHQIESITFSWCSTAEAMAYIQDALLGAYSDWQPVCVSVEPAERHGCCPRCA